MVDFLEFKKAFFAQLDKKTGWGKEEIKRVFNETYIEVSESGKPK